MLFCATLSTKNYSIMGQCMGQMVDPCFSATFWGKKINASQHPYRMPSGINGLFPGLKKCPPDTFCGSFATSAALFESCDAYKKIQPPEWVTEFFGCGGRTRTYDLRVMSPTSFQLLYSAIFRPHSLSAWVLYHGCMGLSRVFS